MSDAACHPTVRFSARRLAAGAFVPPLAVGAVAGLVTVLVWPGALLGFVLLAALVVAVPALLLPGVAAVSREFPATRAPLVVIQSSAFRNLVSVSLAVVIHVAAEPGDRGAVAFWGVFLAAAAAALIGETIEGVRAVGGRGMASGREREGRSEEPRR